MKIYDILITEGRKESVWDKYIQPIFNEKGDNQEITDLFNYIVSKDPSSNQKYLDWFIKVYFNPEKIDYIYNEPGFGFEANVDKMFENIKVFHEKNSMFEKRDINSYKSLVELDTAVLTVTDKLESKKKSKDIKKIYQDGRYNVIQVLTKEASCKYGAGTKWCVSSEKKPQFDSYSQKSRFYFIFDTSKPESDHLYKVAVRKYRGPKYELWDAVDDQMTGSARIKYLETIPSELISSIMEFDSSLFPKINFDEEELITKLTEPHQQIFYELLTEINDQIDEEYYDELVNLPDGDEYYGKGTHYSDIMGFDQVIIFKESEIYKAIRRYAKDYADGMEFEYINPSYFEPYDSFLSEVASSEANNYIYDSDLDDEKIIEIADKEEEYEKLKEKLEKYENRVSLLEDKITDMEVNLRFAKDKPLTKRVIEQKMGVYQDRLDQFTEKRDELQSEVDGFAEYVQDVAYDNYYDELYGEIEDDVFDYFKNHFGYDESEVLKNFSNGFHLDTNRLVDSLVDDFNYEAYRDVFGFSNDTELSDFEGVRYIVMYD